MPPLSSRSAPAGVLGSIQFIWLNLWFWTLAPLCTLIFALLAIPYAYLYYFVTKDRRKTLRLIRRSISCYGAIILKCPWPLVKISFVDHSPQEQPPFVFVSNHPSSSDGFLMAFLPFEAVQILNIWPARIPVLKFVARQAGYLKVREMPFDQFLQLGSELLQQGCSIVAFPEGTRSGHRPMGQFHGSAFRLAQHNNVKIVPIVLAGNKEIPPRGSALLRPGHIVVSKLPAITPADYAGMSAFRLKTLVRETIQKHLDQHPA
jgi:1-acyl-sn-glycerol-3-phosphate acyltransferase